MLGGIALALLAACSRAPAGSAPIPAEDLVFRPGRDAWPPAVRDAGGSIAEAYRFAVANAEVLRYIPCYCGCRGQGHTSNYDCYVREVRPDGSVQLDPHALGCGICVGITRDVAQLAAAGTPLPAIRAAIDTSYSPAGPGTNTPLPPADQTYS